MGVGVGGGGGGGRSGQAGAGGRTGGCAGVHRLQAPFYPLPTHSQDAVTSAISSHPTAAVSHTAIVAAYFERLNAKDFEGVKVRG